MARRKRFGNRILEISILILMLVLLFITWPDKAANNSLRHQVNGLKDRVSNLESQTNDRSPD